MIGGAPIAMMQQNAIPFGMQPQGRAFPQQPAFPQQLAAFPQQQAYPQPSFPQQPGYAAQPQGSPRQPNFAPAPAWQPQPPTNPVAAAPAFPRGPAEPAPVVRGYAQEEPSPAPTLVSLPAPSVLGIAPTKRGDMLPCCDGHDKKTAGPVPSVPLAPAAPVAADLDWNATHQRLRELGAVGFHLDRSPQGGFRVLCVLTGQGQQTQAIEGVGATEAQAVAQAMARAEEMRRK